MYLLYTNQHFYLYLDSTYYPHANLITIFIPAIGTQDTYLSTSYPISIKYFFNSDIIWRYLSLSHYISSILLIKTTRCLIPILFANRACSLVYPFFSKPDSNSPIFALITSAPISAYEVPAIIFGT